MHDEQWRTPCLIYRDLMRKSIFFCSQNWNTSKQTQKSHSSILCVCERTCFVYKALRTTYFTLKYVQSMINLLNALFDQVFLIFHISLLEQCIQNWNKDFFVLTKSYNVLSQWKHLYHKAFAEEKYFLYINDARCNTFLHVYCRYNMVSIWNKLSVGDTCIFQSTSEIFLTFQYRVVYNKHW